MKPFFPLLLLIPASVLLCSCKPYQQRTEVQVIDLSGIWDKPEEILLSSIATDIEYIPLETKPECLLGEPGNLRIILMDHYILAGMRLFDYEGRFIATFGRKGKGPQEYVGAASVACNEKMKRIDVLDAGSDRIVSYGFNGEFIREIPIAKNGARIISDESGRIGIMYLPWREDPSDTARFEWMTETGKLIKTVPLYVGRPKDGGQNWDIGARLYREGDNMCFAEVPYDTIYQLVGDHEWKPRWAFSSWSNKMPREYWLDNIKWSTERGNLTNIYFSGESSRFLFMEVEKQGVYGQCVYDKVTRSGRWTHAMFPPDSTYMITITDDLDGGILPQMTILHYPQGDNYVTALSPVDLIHEFKNHPESKIQLANPEMREKLFALVDQLNEDDNPVIMIVKLKPER